MLLKTEGGLQPGRLPQKPVVMTTGETALAHGDLAKVIRISFSRSSFCLNPVSSLFLRDGRVIGLSGAFRSLCFPLGISVEDHVLEITGFGFEIGADNGRFRESERFPVNHSCVSRCSVLYPPSFFLGKFPVWHG